MKEKVPSGAESDLPLDPSADQIRRWGNSATETIANYLDSIRDRRVYPRTNARQVREGLERALPGEGLDFDGLLKIFNDVIVPTSRHNGHPRMFGSICGAWRRNGLAFD